MTVDHRTEILRLRATVRDLLALSTIPEACVGREPPAIAAELADVLIESLQLDFAFVRLCDPTGRHAVEVTRGDSWKAFPEWLQQRLAVFGQISRKEIVTKVSGVEESCCGIVIPIGVNGERGLVAAACDRSDFPDQIDQQLLSVAANNAATAFRNAHLINELRSAQEALRHNEQELRKARDELGIKVAERTSELHRSELYLAEGQRLGHSGSWVFDPSGSFTYWSQELFRIYGLDPAGEAPSLTRYLACIHPQDREFMTELIREMVAKGLGCDAKKRIVRPDGVVRYIRCVGIPRLENGIVKSIIGTAMDVTDQEEMTQELQRREAYLTEAQRLSHTGSFGWKPDTGEIVWSDETYRIFEFDKGVKLTMESLVQRVHPEDRAGFQKILDGASAGVTQFEHTYRLLLPDGRVKHVHALAHVLQDASGNREFVGAGTDVTERKQAEQSLRQSEAYLTEAQRLSQTGSWAWNPDQDIRYWSEECYRVLGFDPRDGAPRMEEFIRRIHPDDQQAFRESAKRATHTKLDEEVDYRIVHPGGAVRDIHSIGHPVFSPCGNLIAYTGTVIDVTERKRAEEERERLRQAEADLARVTRATTMGELTASLAHEVNQPIAAAIINANAGLRWLARDPPDVNEAREALSRIVKDATRAADIIKRIRSMFKKGTAQREPVDVNEAIRDVIMLMRNEAYRYSVSIREGLATDSPTVMGDRVQLQQVLTNLMLNGIEAMKDMDAARELTVRSEQGDNRHLLISVSDTGVGLAPQQVDKVFDAFFTTKADGTGMGLSISRSIIEAHGGRLWATANQPRGAVFQFTLPSEDETTA
jgi:PAS domain S-box-containing protein